MTLVIYRVLAVDLCSTRARRMGQFDTRAEAEAHAASLPGMFHRYTIVEDLWSLAPLGRRS